MLIQVSTNPSQHLPGQSHNSLGNGNRLHSFRILDCSHHARQERHKNMDDLDVLVREEVLHQGAVSARHAGVVDGEPKGQQLPQRRVLASFRLLLQDLLARRRVLRVSRFTCYIHIGEDTP